MKTTILHLHDYYEIVEIYLHIPYKYFLTSTNTLSMNK